MNVNTMRWVDRWVGVPLCLLVSPFRWVTDRLRSAHTKKPDVSRTLFIELSEMGSAVIVDPAMRKLKQEGGGELYFAIFKKNYKSLRILQTVPDENIFRMNADNFIRLTLDIFRFMAWCRKKKISTVIDLELFSRFTALLSLFSGARTRVGFVNFHDEGLYRGQLMNRPVRYNPHVHIAVNFISLINKALDRYPLPYATTAVAAEEIVLARATIEESEKEAVRNKIRQLYPEWKNEAVVLLNANASDLLPQRRWPQSSFAEVGKKLLEQYPGMLIVATGAPAEKKYVQDVVDAIAHPRCVNSSGIFTFEELVPLYSISTCMLTNDSGPAHFASVTPLKVFVIFGPETPGLYLPIGGNAEPIYLGLPCSPCVSAANHRKTTCVERPCITGIPPQMVLGRMQRFLSTAL